MVRYSDIQKGTPVGIYQLKIKYKGVWDMQDFYESTISYLRERKWKFHEKVYKHKHPSPFGVERQYVWLAEQEVDEFLRVKLNIYIHTYDAHDIEAADKSGQRRIFTEGKLYAYMRAQTVFDYEQKFFQNAFWASILDFMMKYVLRKRVDYGGYNPRYRAELAALHNFMMQRLKMEAKALEFHGVAVGRRRGP